MRRVAITGLGILSPVGNSPAGVFSNLMAGRSGVNRIAAAFSDRLSVKIGAEVSFAPYEYFSHTKLRTLDRVSQFALVATSQALTDAAIALDREDPTRAGVSLGTVIGGAATTEGGYVALYRENADRLQPYTVLMAMNNAAASWVALEHGLEGPSLTFSTACSSSAVAIGEAARQISCGEADIMLAGGTEAPLTYGTMKAWESLRTLAVEDADDASTSCRPFSKDRTGFVLGEGAAILVLEEMDRALRRGAAIYGELIGYSLSTDSLHMTRPSAEGQIRAMRSALEDAAISPDAIDYINAHGTATVQNDAVETAAIKQVFGNRAYHVPISSTKSLHGHLLGAAGAVEFLIAVLALKYQAIPPTANLRIPDPTCDLDYVPNEGRTAVNIRTVMSNSFAFGGTSAVLIAQRSL